jgi:rhomboid-like protein
MFGSILENVWGPKRFLIFYLVTGFGAVLLHVGVQAFMIHKITGSFDPTMAILNAHPEAISTYVSQTLGASGAIFGIATAFAMLFPNTELILLFFPVPIKAKYLMPLYILAELYFGISQHAGDDVAHFAHLGGALFGFILVKIWGRNRNTLY